MKTTTPRPSLRKRTELFNSLPEQGRQLLAQRSYTAVMPLRHWMKVFRVLDKLDRECEAGRKASNKVFTRLLIPVTACLILGIILHPLVLLLALAPAIPAVIFFVRARKFARYDVDNRLRLFIMPLLSLMKGEMDRDAKIKLSVNVKSMESKAYETGRRPLAKVGNTIGGKDIFYTMQWLEMEMQYLDGTLVQVGVTDVLRVRKATKRSMSGKTKYKTKRKAKRTCRVKVKFKTEVYQLRQGQSATVSTPDSLTFKQKATRYMISSKDNSDRNLVLSGISQAYSKVTPLK